MYYSTGRSCCAIGIVTLTLISLLAVFVRPAHAQDSLINLTQWPVAQGGNDHWYAVLPVAHTWVEAESLATTYDVGGQTGHLATIDNSAENYFVFDSVLLDLDPPTVEDQFYLGGFDTGAGAWTWITGEAFCYTNWDLGEPNNVGVETVLSMWGPSESPSPIPLGSWNNTLPIDSINPVARFWSIIEFGPLTASPPSTCGNGIIECGEDCDDGETEPGDGCSPNCVLELPCGGALPGDVNLSGAFTSADVIYLVYYVFRDGPVPQPCEANGDVNCDGGVNAADIIRAVRFVFKGGAPFCETCVDSPLAVDCPFST